MIDLSNKRELYTVHRIKKSNGKIRVIHAPCAKLKGEQKKILRRLEVVPISRHCHGFKKGSSTSDAARPHTDKRWVLTIDIKDFFPSIKTEMLTFLSEYEREVATLDGSLIQGSPCSPIISNIILKEFDEELYEYFSSENISYSRYADDIALSGNDRPERRHVEHVTHKLKERGFTVNVTKINRMFKNESQKVLGIQVNEKLSINRNTRRQLRAAIHQDNLDDKSRGLLAYIQGVNSKQYSKLVG